MAEEKREPLDRKARLKLPPQPVEKRPPEVRVNDWKESYVPWDAETARREAMRCIHCPAAPCSKACPLRNDIPAYLALLESGDIDGAVVRREALTYVAVATHGPNEGTCVGPGATGLTAR